MKSESGITFASPVTCLVGVGEAKARQYARLGIFTLGDLLMHYPRAYENRGDVRLLADTCDSEKASVLLTVASEPRCVRLRSRQSFLKFRAFDDSGSCEIIYFNQDYLRTHFPIGSVFRFFGKVEHNGKSYSMSAPVAEAWTPNAALPPFAPVYPMTEGLSQRQIARDVAMALELLTPMQAEYLPAALLEKRALCNIAYAQRNIHRPESRQALIAARKRLVYDEFFCFALGASVIAKRSKEGSAPPCKSNCLDALRQQLPYRLTGAQERTIAAIAADMAKEQPMSRIVVGDVGCGKTICAMAAMLIAVQSGRQAALMAPTEILARQHYRELLPLFTSFGISCALLIGSTSAAEKRKIKAALASNDDATRLQVVIGTHALLSDGVEFARPGLVITDEQHRFGARQRAKLSEKNAYAHLLVMSATPIPRSLALVLYGDLDISLIDEMPAGRQRVDTFVVDDSYRQRLDGFIRKQVAEGGQVYAVCPAIEEAEDALSLRQIDQESDAADAKPPLKAALPYAEELQKRFPDLKVAFLHGKMKAAEKDAVMNRFVSGEIQILVSTTVIEVGVNVPNAGLMLVENAERFGLSQLHQLRGRVGRGQRKSYCVLVSGAPLDQLGERSRQRLQTMRTTYDGYRIAEQDLAQRGPGDFLGCGDGNVRQSGGLAFRLADAVEDVTLLTEATEDAKALLASDGTLNGAPLLAEKVQSMFAVEEGLIS